LYSSNDGLQWTNRSTKGYIYDLYSVFIGHDRHISCGYYRTYLLEAPLVFDDNFKWEFMQIKKSNLSCPIAVIPFKNGSLWVEEKGGVYFTEDFIRYDLISQIDISPLKIFEQLSDTTYYAVGWSSYMADFAITTDSFKSWKLKSKPAEQKFSVSKGDHDFTFTSGIGIYFGNNGLDWTLKKSISGIVSSVYGNGLYVYIVNTRGNEWISMVYNGSSFDTCKMWDYSDGYYFDGPNLRYDQYANIFYITGGKRFLSSQDGCNWILESPGLDYVISSVAITSEYSIAVGNTGFTMVLK